MEIMFLCMKMRESRMKDHGILYQIHGILNTSEYCVNSTTGTVFMCISSIDSILLVGKYFRCLYPKGPP